MNIQIVSYFLPHRRSMLDALFLPLDRAKDNPFEVGVRYPVKKLRLMAKLKTASKSRP